LVFGFAAQTRNAPTRNANSTVATTAAPTVDIREKERTKNELPRVY